MTLATPWTMPISDVLLDHLSTSYPPALAPTSPPHLTPPHPTSPLLISSQEGDAQSVVSGSSINYTPLNSLSARRIRQPKTTTTTEDATPSS